WRDKRAAQRRRALAKPGTGIAARTPAAGRIAAARGAPRRAYVPNRSLRAARQKDWRSRKSASAYRRCSRQSRPTSAPAPRPAAPDASEATRQDGTWLLTRTQQNTVLSKHVPSK